MPGHAWIPRHAALGRAGRDPQARVGLRPALRVLRDPVVPRLVPVAPAGRHRGRGGLARRQGCARAGAGQRELHVLRQGPARWHPRAGAAAAPARQRAGHRPHPRLLPAARRDAARPDRGHRDHTGHRALLRPLVPARQPHRAAAHAALRVARGLPRPLRPHQGVGARGGHPQQRDRRVPGRDRGRRRRAGGVPGRRPARRGGGLRLLRRGRHRGRGLRRQDPAGGDRRAGRADHGARPRS